MISLASISYYDLIN